MPGITLDTVVHTRTTSGENSVEFTDMSVASNLRTSVKMERVKPVPSSDNAGVMRDYAKITTPLYTATGRYAPIVIKVEASVPASASAADVGNAVDKLKDLAANSEFRSFLLDQILPQGV